MIVAVLADIHDRLDHLARALEGCRQAQALLFLGDFCAPFTLREMAQGFSGPVHAVLGNNDGDALLLERAAREAGHVTLYPIVASLELDGARLALAHYPEVGEALARTGDYQAVFSGHTHQVRQTKVGRTLWINPGELMGRFGRPTYGLYDTRSAGFSLQELGAGGTATRRP